MMRFLLLSLFITIGLNAGEVTLSALIGKVTEDNGLVLGEKLQIDKTYSVGPNSKIQLLLNNTGVITISQNSLFSIKMIGDDSITFFFKQGVYKIINLANQKHRVSLLIETPNLIMDMTNTIALIKITPTTLKAACATSFFTMEHEGKTVTAKKNEMLVMENGSLKKEPVNYDDFHAVINRKQNIDLDKIHEVRDREDPTDLEN